jgi:hypothetical protein
MELGIRLSFVKTSEFRGGGGCAPPRLATGGEKGGRDLKTNILCNAEIQNEWNFNSAPSYIFLVCLGKLYIMYWMSFLIYLHIHNARTKVYVINKGTFPSLSGFL